MAEKAAQGDDQIAGSGREEILDERRQRDDRVERRRRPPRQVREELLTDRQNRFFTAYMLKAKQRMKIDVNREALQRAVG